MTDDVSKSGGTPIIFDGWHSISFSLLWNRVRLTLGLGISAANLQ